MKGKLWRAAAICAVFVISLAAANLLLPRIPGYSALSPYVRTAVLFGIPWLIAVGAGVRVMRGRYVLLISTACVLVSYPIVSLAGSPQPPTAHLPEDQGTENLNVPEGHVAFRFASGFTYLGSETNEPITNVELWLPWPYIDDYDEVGRPRPKPVGVDNWLRLEPLPILLVGPENGREYVKKVWKLENEPSAENYYQLENAAWAIDLPLPGLPYGKVDFEVHLTLYAGDVVEWRDNEIVSLAGGRSSPPVMTAHLPYWADYLLAQKVVIKLSEMYPGETVIISGTFFVPLENENRVRIDDWVESGWWRAMFEPNQENAPHIHIGRIGTSEISISAFAQLEKHAQNTFILIKKYEKNWTKFSLESAWSLIDEKIT